MYATRPRSLYRKYPGALSEQPQQDTPYSGHLVVSNEESESPACCFCCGILKNNKINRLPFPQDRILRVVHSSLHKEASVTKVWFVPVVDQPLSSNRYYIIKAKGRHKGKAYACSREGDIGTCCCNIRRGVAKPTHFDYRDRYQQFEICPYHGGGFFAKSVEWDGYPPSFLRQGGWEVYTSHSIKLHLREAPGLHDSTTTLNFRELNLPLYSKCSTPSILGKWYCPFIFVKEENCRTRDQMRKSPVYELSLKQWWQQIYSCENENIQDKVVVVNARVKRLLCLIQGMEAEKVGRRDADGFVWFRVHEQFRRRVNVGLSSGMFEKMKWLQESRGWFDGDMDVRVSGRKEIESESGWRKFGCYVLVESFVLKRLDGSVLINFSFRNTHKIECKWE